MYAVDILSLPRPSHHHHEVHNLNIVIPSLLAGIIICVSLFLYTMQINVEDLIAEF